jgi:5-deoxy-glucuronate isomerase
MTLTHQLRLEASEGLTLVFDGSNSPLKDLSVSRLRLSESSPTWSAETGEAEVALHVLVGRCSIRVTPPDGVVSEYKELGERRDVFSGLPTTVVVGPGSTYEVLDVVRSVDIAVGSAPAAPGASTQPMLIRPQDVDVHEIGEGHYERSVREVIGGPERASRMRLGETVNPVGKWSSWPHHDFDANPDLAPKFEEVFLYFTKPAAGWGVQVRHGLWTDGDRVDDVIEVHNGDAAVVPLGDHPAGAGVTSELLYVWFYLSPIPKVYARWAEDVGGYA